MSKRRSSRDDDGISAAKKRRTTSSIPVVKHLDPLILSRGSTSRWIGARSKLPILTPEEMDRDLRHMEAYANACTAYSQQYFIYSNRNLVQSGHYGGARTTRGDFVMPVRIDPEEEKRVSQLRTRIAASEKLREVLETEYVSLRAAYVYECHALEKTRENVDSQLSFLQSLVDKRGHVVALQRVRCSMARDILSCLPTRTSDNHTNDTHNDNDDDNNNEDKDMLQVWNTVEMQLKEAERNLKKQQNDGGGVMLWDARALPRTPNDIPLYVSQLSSVPDKSAAFGCGGVFGSKKSSMCWIQSNLPLTHSSLDREKVHVKTFANTVEFLEDELQKERDANTLLQRNISHFRQRNDGMCSLMTMLRSETEAVLARHNILLDTPEARAVAEDLHYDDHNYAKQEQQQDEQQERLSASSLSQQQQQGEDTTSAPLTAEEEEDLDHDGDDEGDDDEDEMFEV